MKKKEKVKKKPWPTKEAMEQVYEMKLWGANNDAFYSGAGSHQLDIIQPYISVVTTFLKSFKDPIDVCDLGCGDFNVGKHLVRHGRKYEAVDIVPAVILFNKVHFTSKNTTFYCLDIANDVLPSGDCAIVRQVLQHLSNTEVQQITKKLRAFKYILLTEHLPKGDFIANKDIISGQGIRLKKQSGLNLLKAPFLMKVKKEKLLLSLSLGLEKGALVTTLYEVY
jgi:SAM-dependent methyltransferase